MRLLSAPPISRGRHHGPFGNIYAERPGTSLTRLRGECREQGSGEAGLACLRGCGLVDYRTEGRQSFYALTRPELMDLLRAAEGVLAATGAPAVRR